MGQTKRPSLETVFSKRFHLRLPLIVAPARSEMAPELVAHISNAGAIGQLNCASLSPAEMTQAIALINRLTPRPYALSLSAPNEDFFFEAQFEAVLRASPSIFIFEGFILEKKDLDAARDRGIITVGCALNFEEAEKLEQLGVHYISLSTSGNGEDSLVQVQQKLKTPFIADVEIEHGARLAQLIKLGAVAVKSQTLGLDSVALLHQLEKEALATLKP